MSSTTSISSLASNTATTVSSTTDSNTTIDFNDFLTLLTTELQYQDPTDPLDTSEYMSQMVGIESLQQLNNIYTMEGTSQAISLIGKEVSYQTTDSGGTTTTATGVVDSVSSSSAGVYLNIDGTKVELSSVYEVTNADTDSTST
ncbi:MAG TPA: flagellar hook capping FlgD N-terminal domain-containing protein [Methylomusa anaerophila]|uniref:Flagellar basal body rod modification protein n=1 Tax=Methylomusa anaerophila TaxID=1930071 RepID=A0A348AH59_9FIRM|nr:flagellar hook capping FlgD N-terminal domain-containing protein [Methylomusa anaerophila]BBB90407.1 flagellar basal body rod modification protein [Methylomusa anaerophila]HML90378.1 flagellar hook capping FlgD N-terminal domain-containing protein [Methylomusa anaerophila]